ncbi:hypothetical protein K1719_017473 [Acacia pycnantha]|nr:hypothetical protein K1719_017473 [Acacia pycnantha]
MKETPEASCRCWIRIMDAKFGTFRPYLLLWEADTALRFQLSPAEEEFPPFEHSFFLLIFQQLGLLIPFPSSRI